MVQRTTKFFLPVKMERIRYLRKQLRLMLSSLIIHGQSIPVKKDVPETILSDTS